MAGRLPIGNAAKLRSIMARGLEKAGPHKYKSRKKVGGRWVYDYGDKTSGGSKGTLPKATVDKAFAPVLNELSDAGFRSVSHTRGERGVAVEAFDPDSKEWTVAVVHPVKDGTYQVVEERTGAAGKYQTAKTLKAALTEASNIMYRAANRKSGARLKQETAEARRKITDRKENPSKWLRDTKPKVTSKDDGIWGKSFTVPAKRFIVPKVGKGSEAPEALTYEELVDTLEKAGGWGPIPAGKRGGQRKRVGMKWVYRYPDGKGGWQSGTARKKSDAKKKAAAKKQAEQTTLDFGKPDEPAKPEPGLLGEIARLAVSALKLGDVLRPFGDQGFKITAIGQQGKKIKLATLDTNTGESVELVVNPGDKVWAQQAGPAKPKSPEKAPKETPRGEAETTTEEMVVESEYVNDRASKVEQRGEDVLGSARHKMAVWKGLREALDDREWAGDMFTRKFLQREKPVDFLGRAQKAPGSLDIKAQLHLYLSAQKFPATIPKTSTIASWYRTLAWEERKAEQAEAVKRGENPHDMPPVLRFHEISEEKQQEYTDKYVRIQREGYYRAFMLVNDSLEKQSAHVAESGASERAGIDMTAVNVRFKELQAQPYSTRIVDAEYETLRKYYNAHAGRGKSRPTRLLANMMREIEAQYPDNEDGQLKAFQEAALKVMEGKSINKALDNVKKRDNDFNVADFYDTGVMRRKGPPSRYKGINQGLDLLDKGSGKSVYEMRGVQWGKSVTDSEREHHLKSIVDSWDDLAWATGLPQKMASYNGKLALAVGARGHGSASAHYEPTQNVINLTRNSGAGALAHEWGHFFDFEVAKAELREGQTDRKTPMSEKWTQQQQGPTGKAVAALKSSEGWKRFDARLSGVCRRYKMSRGKVQYWRSDLEMFARCFERHVQRKLHKAGRENTYLTGLSAGSITEDKGLWPTDAETDALAPFFEKVFEEFKTSGLLEKMMRWAEEDSLRKAAFTVPKKRFVVGDIR